MDPKPKNLKTAKIIAGTFFSILVVLWFLFLKRMADVRAALQHPESGLFLARALVLMAIGACLVLAIWGFVSIFVKIKSPPLSKVLVALYAILGAACLIFCIFIFLQVCKEYAVWPGGALF